MHIEHIHIQNFTVFEDIEIDFSKGLNILVGTNGTGKTHILKLLYAICESVNHQNQEEVFEVARPYFSVESSQLIRNKKDLSQTSQVDVRFTKESTASYMITRHEGGTPTGEWASYTQIDSTARPVFIPAKEMLSHSRGFLALNNKYKIPFDKTYIDIITNAELPETREDSILNELLLHELSSVIDGEVIHETGVFYVLKRSGEKVEFPLEAEGFRKFGLLWKLIKNGLLEKGTVLFWDEPEANINPELMPLLVEVLLKLQRKGVQIFLATHSYNLAKYIEVKQCKEDEVLYHYLYTTEQGVKAESHPLFGEVSNNPLIKADAQLLDEVIADQFNE